MVSLPHRAREYRTKEQVLSSSSYNAAHHYFTLFVAVVAFLLLIAGGLVTSNNAGLAVPDWPTSFGSLYRMPRMIGGIKFEHRHRMVAELVGLLTVGVAVWTWLVGTRRWMRLLTLGAGPGGVAQGGTGRSGLRQMLAPRGSPTA